MAVKISNIAHYEKPVEKPEVDYRIKATVVCKKHHATFDAEYITNNENMFLKVDCPVCGESVSLPSKSIFMIELHIYNQSDDDCGCYIVPEPTRLHSPILALHRKHRVSQIHWSKINDCKD